jgi:hypothetical protein
MKIETREPIINIRTSRALRTALIERATQLRINPSELARLAIAQALAAPIGVMTYATFTQQEIKCDETREPIPA